MYIPSKFFFNINFSFCGIVFPFYSSNAKKKKGVSLVFCPAQKQLPMIIGSFVRWVLSVVMREAYRSIYYERLDAMAAYMTLTSPGLYLLCSVYNPLFINSKKKLRHG